MRVAVIGTGTMGGRHAQLLAGMPGVTELLVADVDERRASAAAEAVGARPVSNAAALDEADAVVIATPAETHAELVEGALERGVPVLCEKPLTDDLGSSLRIARRAEAAAAHVEVGFQRRHDPGYVEARAAVGEGRAGAIRLLRLTAFDPLVEERAIGDWPETETAPLFLHSSIHDFDFVRWVSGQEVAEVSAEGSRRDGSRPSDPRGMETAVVTMRMSGGALAVLEATWLHPAGYDNRVEIVTEGTHVSAGLSPSSPVRNLESPGDGAAEPWTHYLARFEAAYRAELESFLAACRGERPPASIARDGLEAMRIAVAATRAYRERRPVRLDQVPDL